MKYCIDVNLPTLLDISDVCVNIDYKLMVSPPNGSFIRKVFQFRIVAELTNDNSCRFRLEICTGSSREASVTLPMVFQSADSKMSLNACFLSYVTSPLCNISFYVAAP